MRIRKLEIEQGMKTCVEYVEIGDESERDGSECLRLLRTMEEVRSSLGALLYCSLEYKAQIKASTTRG